MKMESPCLTCTRVFDTENCTDKSCRVWRAWFLEQWEQTRQSVGQLKNAPPEPVGVDIGGVYYSPPHRVEDYLQVDPCTVCRCPEDLCPGPCRKRQVWEQCYEEVKG